MADGARHGVNKARLLRGRQVAIHPDHLRHLAIVPVVAEHADLHSSQAWIEGRRQIHLHVVDGIRFAQHQGNAAVRMPHDAVRPKWLPMKRKHVGIERTGDFNARYRPIIPGIEHGGLDDVIPVKNLFLENLVV